MAGSNTVTTSQHGTVTQYSCDWLSDAAGDVNSNSFTIHRGTIVRVRYTPDGGGTQPTDLYDVVLNDANSVDLLTTTGANLSNTTASQDVPYVTHGTLTETTFWQPGGTVDLVVSAAGNAKGGVVDIYIRREG